MSERPSITIVTPAPRRSRRGNRVSALRWARVLRGLGYRVRVRTEWDGEAADAMLALHARRSGEAIARWAASHPQRPLLVALTGTDLYSDVAAGDTVALQSLRLATRLVTLHPAAVDALPPEVREKSRAILQSVDHAPHDVPAPSAERFEVCVLGHLREVKDPLRAAHAARLLPDDSRVHVVAIGSALTPEMHALASDEAASNPRYEWVGELPRHAARRRMAGCRLVVLSSRQEGGANVVGEAIAARVPLLCSRIAGSVGLLGDDYPGYFEVADSEALAALLRRAETESSYLAQLREACEALRPLFSPEEERRRWVALLDDVGLPVPVRA